MISLCAVLVSTLHARGWISAFSKSHESLSRSASRPSSTAANVTSAVAPGPGGLPSKLTLMRATAFSRTWYCGLSGVTLTVS